MDESERSKDLLEQFCHRRMRCTSTNPNRPPMSEHLTVTNHESGKISGIEEVSAERGLPVLRVCLNQSFNLVSQLNSSLSKVQEDRDRARFATRDLFQGLALCVPLHPFVDHLLRHLPNMFGSVPPLNTILLQVPKDHRLARLRIRILQPVESGDLHCREFLRKVKLFKLLLLRPSF